MEVVSILCGEDNYSYIVVFNNQAIIIDPLEPSGIIEYLDNNAISPILILNTHHHFDHVGGNIILKKKYHLEIKGADAKRIPGIDQVLDDNDILKFLDIEVQVLKTPGHTNDSVCFLFKDNKSNRFLFSGDTLFKCGCGRNFEGDISLLFNSFERLKKISKNTYVFFGHEYTYDNYMFAKEIDKTNLFLQKEVNKIGNASTVTTPSSIAKELSMNPFFRVDDQNIRSFLNMQHAKDLDVFKKLRELKNQF